MTASVTFTKTHVFFNKVKVANLLPCFTYYDSEYREINIRCAHWSEILTIKYHLYFPWECKITSFCIFSSRQLSLQVGYKKKSNVVSSRL